MRRTRAEWRGGAKKHKKPLNSYRPDMESGGKLRGRSKKRRQDSVGSVGADRGLLENEKEAERVNSSSCCVLHSYCRAQLLKGYNTVLYHPFDPGGSSFGTTREMFKSYF